MTAADPRDGLHGLVAKWRDPESPPLNQDQLRQAIRNGARLDCADDLEQALAHARPEAVDEAMISDIAKKLLKLRLTEVGGRKEHPATTVKACLKAGLGGLYDDAAADYIVRAVMRYYAATLTPERAP